LHGSVIRERTRIFRIRLAHLEFAHDFVNKIAALVAHIARVEEILELGIKLEPPVGVPSASWRTPSLRFPFVASTMVPVTEMHFCFTIKRWGL